MSMLGHAPVLPEGDRMSFTLHVDTERWDKFLAERIAELPDLVPVAKGNGYGLTLPVLATQAARMGVDTLAVGLPEEVAPVREHFDGSILVLTPFHVGTPDAPCDPSVIRTVAHLDSLRVLADCGSRPRVVLELASSMRRHGLRAEDLASVAELLPGVTMEGWALHLPLVGSHIEEVRAAIALITGNGLAVDTLWVSHLRLEEVRQLAGPDLVVRPRVGTGLWLGDRAALTARGTVLDRQPVRAGDAFGYRQLSRGRSGTLVVVSGGTSHGVGLVAPKPMHGVTGRAKVVASALLEAGGRMRSPFYIGGKRAWFAETPHMQLSMLFVPSGVTPPEIGDELRCDVRMTTTDFDRVLMN